jgi:sterol desaturase/sphingolipid hydroxylase (fatty acid hydroxylase superfamily)
MVSSLFSNMNERIYFTVVTCLIHTGTFVITNGLLFAFHYMKWFERYKIQGNGAYPDMKLIMACVKENIIGHLIVAPVAAYFAYPLYWSWGMSLSDPFPSVAIVLRDFVVAIAVNDTLFYWAHRGFHHPAIYKYIHKQHHEFKTPVGIASKYAHPVEDVIANTLPTVLGPLLIGMHAKVFWLWLFVRLLETIDAHSGYSFPCSPFHMFAFQGGAERHDFHHSHNVGCFGSFTIFWDWICGTDQAFLEWKAKTAAKKAADDSKAKAH